METIKYTKMDKKQIINTLMKGGLLAFPTDTVFGLACMMDEKAIKKEIKKTVSQKTDELVDKLDLQGD